MNELKLHFTFYLLKKFKRLMKAGISAPITYTDKIWRFVFSKNLFKIKTPEAASGCCEKLE